MASGRGAYPVAVNVNLSEVDANDIAKASNEMGVRKSELIRFLVWTFLDLYRSDPERAKRAVRGGIIQRTLK